MKKFFAIIAVMLLAVVLGACGSKEKSGNFDVPNGKYFAAGDFENGYRYWVVVDVKDKKITNLEWNGYSIDGGENKCAGDDKLTCAADADHNAYGMNGDLGTWGEQSKAATDWVIKNQQIVTPLNDERKADAITTASIHTEGMFDLIFDAFKNGPVPAGDYTDGYYYIESTPKNDSRSYSEAYLDADGNPVYLTDTTGANVIKKDDFSSYTMGTFVIVNGTIVLADINASFPAYQYITDADGKYVAYTKDNVKYTTILMVPKKDNSGNVIANEYVPAKTYVTKDSAYKYYGMSQVGKVEWSDQMKAVEEKLLADQDLSFTVTTANNDTKGTVDGLASVSVGHSVVSVKEILDELKSEAE